jgi:hypothetical protein
MHPAVRRRSIACFACAGLACASDVTVHNVAGQKIDSGLADLPHYSQWADKTGKNVKPVNVAGQKLDSGLGDLPHYSQWVDRFEPTHKVASSARPQSK